MKLIKVEHPPIGGVEVLGHTLWQGWIMVAALAYSIIGGHGLAIVDKAGDQGHGVFIKPERIRIRQATWQHQRIIIFRGGLMDSLPERQRFYRPVGYS